MKKYKFIATIEGEEPHKNSAFLRIPFDSKKEFGTAGTIRIKVNIEGYVYRGTLIPVGSGIHILGLGKDIRERIGKNIGDSVNVAIEKDNDAGTIDLPGDFKIAMEKNGKAFEDFIKMPYSHQRQYVEYINDAKKEETRRKRIDKAIERIADWKK